MAKHTSKKRNENRDSRKGKLRDQSMPQVRIFRDIGILYTLQGAMLKSGRCINSNDLSPIENAALVAVDGKIVWTGAERQLPKKYLNWRANAKGNLKCNIKVESLNKKTVLPAFVESHTHLIFAGNRAAEFERRNTGETYQSIAQSGGGILSTVRPTRAQSLVDLASIGQVRADKFLVQGVTTLEAKSGYGLSVDSELKLLRAAGKVKKLRIVRTFLGAHAIPPEFNSAQDYIEELIEFAFPVISSEKLACRADIFVEDGYFSKKQARQYLQAARKFDLDLVLHADQLTRSGGAELAVEMQARSADHLLRISERDIRNLAKSEVTCVLLPNADLYMASPYPPARRLIEKGARVALATDFNPGSAPSLDLALTGVLARVQMKMTLPEVISAYTIGGAHALGFGSKLGALVSGMWADFSVLSGSIEELFLEVGHMPISRVYREAERLV